MSHVLLVGCGRMSRPIAYMLSELGYDITLTDISSWAMEDVVDCLDTALSRVDRVPIQSIEYGDVKTDLVFYAGPYEHSIEVARRCIPNGIRYCDLGGNIQCSKKINDLAKNQASKPVMTDLGLAPGLINILAEKMYHDVRSTDGTIESLEMYCGGLPKKPQNDLQYEISFSVEGLTNEYFNTPYSLINREIQQREPMGDCDNTFIDKKHFEAFNTSGGAHKTLELMKSRGVKNCFYKTLRYKGHREKILFLKSCGLNQQQIGKAIQTCCSPTLYDIVYIKIASFCLNKNNKPYLLENNFSIKNNKKFTAMQRATGFSAAAVAALLADGKLDKYSCVQYSDIPLDDFFKKLGRFLPEVDK